MSLIGLVHTTRLVVEPLHSAVTGQCPDVEVTHVMDEGILRRLSTLGTITPEIVQWLTDMVTSAQVTGADVVVVSCSSLSPCVGEVQKGVVIPIIKIDEPMMEHALLRSKRIGLVMTNPTTEKPSTQLFHDVAKRLEKKATLVPKLCPDAFAKLNKGDVAGHDAEVVATVETLLDEVDVVMLAQISIARIRKGLNPAFSDRVYSSLDFIGSRITEVLRQQEL